MGVKPVTFVPVHPGSLIEFSGCKSFLFLNISNSFVWNKSLDKLSENNLRMVDSNLPEILGEFLSYMLNRSVFSSRIRDLVEFHDKKGLLRMSHDYPVSFYDYKMKSLIRALVLGMDNEKVWLGEPNLYDYYPVLESNAELIHFGLEPTKCTFMILESLSLDILNVAEAKDGVTVDFGLILNHFT